MRVPVTIRQKPLFCATCKAAGEESRLFIELGAEEVSCSKKHGFPSAEAAERALEAMPAALAAPQSAPAEVQASQVQEFPLEPPEAAYEPAEPVFLPPLDLEPMPWDELTPKMAEDLSTVIREHPDVVLPVAVEEPVIEHGLTVVSQIMPKDKLVAAHAPAQVLEKGKEVVVSGQFAPANGKAQVVHDKRTGDLIVGIRIPELHVSSLLAEAENQKEGVHDYVQRIVEFGLDARWFF